SLHRCRPAAVPLRLNAALARRQRGDGHRGALETDCSGRSGAGATGYDRGVTVTGDLLLWNARLLDGRGGPPPGAVAIAVRGGLVAGVEDIASATPPDGARDLAGQTVLPGLIDAHMHVMSDLERSPGF